MPKKTFITALLAVAALLCQGARAADIIFAAPPRETAKVGEATYGPIADYLSKSIGIHVIYRHPPDWPTYIERMQHDAYDLVFDGPHFVSWRIAKRGHVPLVKLPGSLDFVVITRRDNPAVTELSDLAGRAICGHAPPNLATLTLQAQFPNPTRQPMIIATEGFLNAFKGVIEKHCDGAVLPSKIYARLDQGKYEGATRVLFKSRPVPQQAFTASRRIPPEIRQKIIQALLAPDARKPTAKLRQRFAGGQSFLAATAADYQGLDALLKGIWGFNR